MAASGAKLKTIVCRATVTSEKGVITQTNGNGEVQIDVPLAPLVTPPTAIAVVAPAPASSASPAPEAAKKALTRLEMLKQQRGKP